MFHHIRKFSSTVKAASSPISSVLYPKNKKKVVRGVMVMEEEDQKSLIEEEETNKKPPPPVEISLRPFQLTDVDDIMAWATTTDDDQLTRYCGGWEEMGIYTSKEKTLEEIKTHPWNKAICLKNENQPIGKIFVDPYTGAFRFRAQLPFRAQLSYVVALKQLWGKGIATTAVKMVLDTIFKEWPHLERLDALVDVENLGSQRVLEKAGFKKDGVHSKKYYLRKGGGGGRRTAVDTASFSFLSTDYFKGRGVRSNATTT